MVEMKPRLLELDELDFECLVRGADCEAVLALLLLVRHGVVYSAVT